MLDLGRECEITALGKVWKTSRFTIELMDQFAAWIKAQVSDPYEGLDKLLPLLPKDEAMAEIARARETRAAIAGIDFTSPLFVEWLNKPRGAIQAFYLLLRPNHPDVTLATVFEILQELGVEEMQRTLTETRGTVPDVGNGQAPVLPGQKESTGLPSIVNCSTASNGPTRRKKSAV